MENPLTFFVHPTNSALRKPLVAGLLLVMGFSIRDTNQHHPKTERPCTAMSRATAEYPPSTSCLKMELGSAMIPFPLAGLLVVNLTLAMTR